MTRAAIFDLDGTLIDSERLILDAGALALEAMGIPEGRARLVALVGTAGDQAALLRGVFGETFDTATFESLWDEEAARAWADGIPPRAGAVDLLRHLLDTGVPLALATNSPTDWAHRRLAEAGLDHAFPPEHVWGRDRVERPKPAPDLFLAAARGLGIAPADCVAFEDSDPGTAAALAAGMTVVQIPDQRPAGTRDAHHLAESLLDGARAAGLI
ncbi:HAD family hydrolase [Wenxinia saemankumensis]|uniref:Haloacid dehalogenase superfamily, subfamily IA, variant 3 with third motif having DD or ED n=1 Tax=Wenxinia saemankumensis TaxID=1447782 RepID=A0A1M6ECT6_9RHOB|nr:HAD family phosphatase [Wenxinia saemankumensis]SHI83285.1 haloacid dehalogenase superfamily, subfamily IA, variant 3 with third motif having DD or ED [Wenxinia saemankumensis]